MAGLVVPVVFVLGCLAVVAGRDRLGFGHSLREAALAAGILCGGFVWASVELLSLTNAVRPWPVRGCWAAVAIVLAAVVWCNRENLRGQFPQVRWTGSATAFYATACGAVMAWTGLTATLVPCTNIDGLVYHLPRQLQWLQNGDVAHFPAQDYRLTVNPPFAEFCGLTMELLTGRDRWANTPQWVALGLAMTAVSLTARELGAPRGGQWLAAALVATLPIAFQQAASPKNDLTAGCWLAAVGYWMVRAWTAPPTLLAPAALAGLSVGLLALTKGTGVVFAAPAVLLGFVGLLVRQPNGWVAALPVFVAPAVLVPAGHWQRNIAAYGSLNGQTFGLGVEPLGVCPLASNIVRNLSAQASLPADGWNGVVSAFVASAHSAVGIPLNDPASTWQASLGFKLTFDPASWEEATAPVHWLLAGAALVALPFTASGPTRTGRVVASLAAVGALVGFSAVFKWQPSNARLLLPVEILFAAPAAAVLTTSSLRWLGPLSIGAAVLILLPIVAKNAEQMPGIGRPWADRWSPEVRYGPYADAAYLGRLTAGRVQLLRPASVGLVNNPSSGWEYPVARTIREWVSPPPRIVYFYPTPEIPDPSPPPDVVVDFSGEAATAVIRHPGMGRAYHRTDRIGPFSVYQKLDPGQEADGTGYRLTPDGGWEPVTGHPPGPPPTGTQAVARFGVRIDTADPVHEPRSAP